MNINFICKICDQDFKSRTGNTLATCRCGYYSVDLTLDIEYIDIEYIDSEPRSISNPHFMFDKREEKGHIVFDNIVSKTKINPIQMQKLTPELAKMWFQKLKMYRTFS